MRRVTLARALLILSGFAVLFAHLDQKRSQQLLQQIVIQDVREESRTVAFRTEESDRKWLWTILQVANPIDVTEIRSKSNALRQSEFEGLVLDRLSRVQLDGNSVNDDWLIRIKSRGITALGLTDCVLLTEDSAALR